jgi:transcriptional regulator with XRE-family HTH domain
MSRSKPGANEYAKEVGRALTSSGKTEATLAELAGVSPAYVSALKHGKKSPSAQWCDLVADVLRLSERDRRRLHLAAARDKGFKL